MAQDLVLAAVERALCRRDLPVVARIASVAATSAGVPISLPVPVVAPAVAISVRAAAVAAVALAPAAVAALLTQAAREADAAWVVVG